VEKKGKDAGTSLDQNVVASKSRRAEIRGTQDKVPPKKRSKKKDATRKRYYEKKYGREGVEWVTNGRTKEGRAKKSRWWGRKSRQLRGGRGAGGVY